MMPFREEGTAQDSEPKAVVQPLFGSLAEGNDGSTLPDVVPPAITEGAAEFLHLRDDVEGAVDIIFSVGLLVLRP